MKLVMEQFFTTTAEDEKNYFTGQSEPMIRPRPNAILQSGTYRVVNGSLYRVIYGYIE